MNQSKIVDIPEYKPRTPFPVWQEMKRVAKDVRVEYTLP